jgi:KaiC/GvpD/RAD55 family RecA-like ATPase
MIARTMKYQFPLFKPFIRNSVPTGNVILIGPPGIGKTLFCETNLVDYLNSGNNSLYIALESDPREIKVRLFEPNENLEEKSTLLFIDGYSWLVGGSDEKYALNNLSNLSDLSVKIISASTALNHNLLFIFDSISTLLIYNSENEVERFLRINMARMKHFNNVGFWILEEGIHSNRFYNVLRQRSDCVLEMCFEEQSELTRAIRMHTCKTNEHETRWLPFRIVDGRFMYQNNQRENNIYTRSSLIMKNS